MPRASSTNEVTTRASTIGEAFALVGLVLILTLIASIVAPALTPLVWVVSYQLVVVAAPVAIFVYQRRREVSIGLTWPTATEAIIALVLGAAVALANIGVVIPLSPLTTATESPIGEAVTNHPLAISLLALAFVPAISEELLFRGVLLSALAARGRGFAVVLSALLFAGFHFSPAQLLPLFVVGLATGIAAVSTGSVISAMLVHVANNGLAVVLMHQRPEAEIGIELGLLGVLGIAVSTVVLLRARLR